MKSKWARIIAYLFGGVALVSLFIPYISLTFRSGRATFTGLNIITARAFEASSSKVTAIISLPFLLKFSIIAAFVLISAAIIILFFKKVKLASAFFIIAAMMPFMTILSINSIRTAVASASISQMGLILGPGFILLLVFCVGAAIASMWILGGEELAKSIFFIFALASVGVVALITIYVIASGLPVIANIGFFDFIFGKEWKPNSNSYGILPMILSSIFATLGAIVIGLPLGIFTAAFLSEEASPKIAAFIRPAVELLAGIPSVIYGFFGMLVIVPFIRNIGHFLGIDASGDSLLAAIIILSIMVLPTIISVAETSLKAVPKSYREGALALGASKTRTIYSVTIPAAKRGILSGVILGVGRAIGETMAVIMVAGNVVNMPELFSSVRFLTTGIALELSYSSGLHKQALFAIGLILFVFIAIIDIAFIKVSKGKREKVR